MKAIDSMWFSTMRGLSGIVVGEDEMGKRNLYAGTARGFDQKADEKAILSWGNRVNIDILKGLIAKVTNK